MEPQEVLADYIRRYASSFKVIGWTIDGLYHNITTYPSGYAVAKHKWRAILLAYKDRF